MAKMGRPLTYETEAERLEAGAKAAKEYRSRKKALKLARKDVNVPLTSDVIDLTSTLRMLKS